MIIEDTLTVVIESNIFYVGTKDQDFFDAKMTSVPTRHQQPTSTTITASSKRFSPVLDPDKPLLWEKFGLYGRYGQVYDVKLRDDRVSVTKEDSNGATTLEVRLSAMMSNPLFFC